jgi:hypothetical protein
MMAERYYRTVDKGKHLPQSRQEQTFGNTDNLGRLLTLSFHLAIVMDFVSLSAIARIKVQIFHSMGGPAYNRSTATLKDVDLLEPIMAN